LISIPLRGFTWPRWIDEAFGLVNLPADPSLFTVVLLFVLGSALRRRIRFAMWVVFAFQVIAVLVGGLLIAAVIAGHARDVEIQGSNSGVILGLRIFEGFVGLALCVMLVKARDAFPARLVRGSRVRALAVLLGGLAVSATVAIILTQAFPRDLEPGWQRVAWPLRAAIGQLPDEHSTAFHGHHGHHWIAILAGVISAISLIAAAMVFLRSARAKQFVGAQEELEVRRLVLEGGDCGERGGRGSLRGGRPSGDGSRRRSDHRYRYFHLGRPHDGPGTSCRGTRAARRLHHGDSPAR
jgi:lysyl-tRNA synthetase class 2